ncbi:hypothetical protein CDAR_107231 [Caerostris darwini]|uniref:Uncharacterized protein n=1 Tax=Caerostris darwini TaxID=1538125 RepID=A0AAV4UU98_9ARAC|nr:hypothetical protein CDAR_107231 [Caerostris darwini]
MSYFVAKEFLPFCGGSGGGCKFRMVGVGTFELPGVVLIDWEVVTGPQDLAEMIVYAKVLVIDGKTILSDRSSLWSHIVHIKIGQQQIFFMFFEEAIRVFIR